jgi:hypothetical protein
MEVEQAIESHGIKRRFLQVAILLPITGFYIIIINPFISFDGWQYISSARSLFDRREMAQHYFWVREPGFPLLVKVTTLNNSFLWGLIIFNLFLFMMCFFYLFIQIMKSTQLSNSLENTYLFISFFGSINLVGGYAGNFGRDSIIISLNLLFSALCISVFKNQTNAQTKSTKFSLCLTLLFSATFSEPLSYAFGITLVLLLIGKHFAQREKPKLFDFSLYTSTLVTSLMVIPFYWRKELRKSINDPLFNQQNFADPMWDLSVGQILSRFLEDIVLIQTIPIVLLSLLGIGANLGWIFSRNEAQISPSQNADIGYGLFAQHYPNCNVSKPHGFIADIEFLQEEAGLKLCGISGIDLPNILFYPIYTIYLMLLVFFLFSIKTIVSTSGGLYLISYLGSTFVYISFFAISGGAIDRYGALLIPIVFVNLGLLIAHNSNLKKLVN